jgi:hypothetical protein
MKQFVHQSSIKRLCFLNANRTGNGNLHVKSTGGDSIRASRRIPNTSEEPWTVAWVNILYILLGETKEPLRPYPAHGWLSFAAYTAGAFTVRGLVELADKCYSTRQPAFDRSKFRTTAPHPLSRSCSSLLTTISPALGEQSQVLDHTSTVLSLTEVGF